MERYDVIVVGLGAMGSATAYHLARRGRKVLGLEQFDIPHFNGSSHGITRVIRLAYYEHPSYVPLLRRAYELWRELQQLYRTPLLHITGSMDIGPDKSQIVEGSIRSCEIHGLPYEVLNSVELARRLPAYTPPSETIAVFQPDGGFLLPELCIVAHVTLAQAHGANIHAREPVLEWAPQGGGVKVITSRAAYEGCHLVVAAGAWVGKIVKPLSTLAQPERQVLGWFQPYRPELFMPDRFPVFNLATHDCRYYGLPIFGIPGFKVGKYHHLKEAIDPDHRDFECHPKDESVLREFVDQYFPEGGGPTMSLRACMFTNTPDENFVLDFHPDYPQVAIASPCSGHGFKFSSVVGEIMADLVERGETSHDISLHRLARFKP